MVLAVPATDRAPPFAHGMGIATVTAHSLDTTHLRFRGESGGLNRSLRLCSHIRWIRGRSLVWHRVCNMWDDNRPNARRLLNPQTSPETIPDLVRSTNKGVMLWNGSDSFGIESNVRYVW